VQDGATMLAELTGASDRSIVITLAAFLDAALEGLIARHIRPQTTLEEFDETFGFSGPLGSFSARIKIAHLFGLIDDTGNHSSTLFENFATPANTRNIQSRLLLQN
jgi:hypothetical protein